MSLSKTLTGNNKNDSSGEALIFGEVLFDCFPDGKRILGGAPFNVAWGLQGFGCDPYFCSAVGDDADGNAIKQMMADWDMCSDGLQTSSTYATGKVDVQFKEGEPQYEICEDRAWDNILMTEVPDVELIYHGSLVLRNQTSADTFEALVDSSKAKRFFDVNLREPYYTKTLLSKWLKGADWVKLNLDELAYVVGEASLQFCDAEAHVDILRERFSIANVLLTAGEQGALIKGSYGYAKQSPAVSPKDFVDTVGAGDSFTAVTIAGILKNSPVDKLMQQASAFAAKVCGLRGATTMEREFYQI